jgi:hypothetical protein
MSALLKNPNYWRNVWIVEKIQITGQMSGLLKIPNYWRNVRIIERSKLLGKCPDY